MNRLTRNGKHCVKNVLNNNFSEQTYIQQTDMHAMRSEELETLVVHTI